MIGARRLRGDAPGDPSLAYGIAGKQAPGSSVRRRAGIAERIGDRRGRVAQRVAHFAGRHRVPGDGRVLDPFVLAVGFDDHAERIYREKIHPASGASYLLEAVIDSSWPKYMQDRKGPANWYWPGA